MSSIPSVAKNAALSLKLRASEARGKADHGWLKSFHTWSFANYYDPKFSSFGPLRVLNEDRVSPSKGFGAHSHAEFEIFSYLVSGELEHKDSMGNVEVMKRGDLQMTSAGTGITHAEVNPSKSKAVHFLQIWALPNTPRLKPAYSTRHFPAEAKRAGLVPVVAPINSAGVSSAREADGPAPVNADLHLLATILAPGQVVYHTFKQPLSGGKKRKAFVHVIQTSGFNTSASYGADKGARIVLNDDLELGEGDAAFVEGGVPGKQMGLVNVGDKEAEVLVFDLGE